MLYKIINCYINNDYIFFKLKLKILIENIISSYVSSVICIYTFISNHLQYPYLSHVSIIESNLYEFWYVRSHIRTITFFSCRENELKFTTSQSNENYKQVKWFK